MIQFIACVDFLTFVFLNIKLIWILPGKIYPQLLNASSHTVKYEAATTLAGFYTGSKVNANLLFFSFRLFGHILEAHERAHHRYLLQQKYPTLCDHIPRRLFR